MIPEGWKKKSLEDVAEIRGGLAKGKDVAHEVVHRPYLRVANVQDGYLDLQIMKEIEVQVKDIERYSLRYGDVVLTEGGDFDKLGRGAVWKEQIQGCLHQNHVFAVRADSDILLPDFFAAQSASHYGKSYYLTCAKRSTNLASINSTQLKQFPVLLPPLPEQRRIAEILATWDRGIETVEALIANARAQKKALMQSLLTGKHRLPGCSGKWGEARLGSMAELFAGGTPSTAKAEYWGGDIPWMSSGEINLREICSVEGRITELGLSASSAKMVPVNSVLIALAGQGTTRGKVAITRALLCTNQSVAAIIPQAKLNADYLFYNLDTRYDELRSLSLGDGGRGGLNLSILKSIVLPIPAIEEQIEIASVLYSAGQQVAILETKLTAFRQEKSALMQQLLTGKRRVNVGEEVAA